MKSTPINAWPVAQDIDPVKQYPTAVDDPFKADLDHKIVMRFANAADRTAKRPTPAVGDVCYLTDMNQYQAFDTAWYPLAGMMPAGSMTWGGNVPIGAGTQRLTNPSGTGAEGGMTYANSCLVAPHAGSYLIVAMIGFGGTSQYCQVQVGTDVASTDEGDRGTESSSAYRGGLSVYRRLAAGDKVCLWSYTAQAWSVNLARIQMNYQGR